MVWKKWPMQWEKNLDHSRFLKNLLGKRLNNLVRAINDGFEKGEMSSTQKEGIICIPKGDKPREYLKNWRPNSLLNVMYRCASSCIAELKGRYQN